jgi:DNA polymerase III delta subunit
MNSPTPVVYVFYGQDEPTLKDTLVELCARATDAATADLNTTRFDGREVEVGTIQSAASTFLPR